MLVDGEPSGSVGFDVVLDCLSEVHSAPQHGCEIRRAVESEQADDPRDDEDWHGCQKNFGSAEEGQG